MSECRCNTVGVPPAFRGLGITSETRNGRTRGVGDLWTAAGSIFSGLGTIAGAVLPTILGPGNTSGGGQTLVVANPNQTTGGTRADDNSRLMIYAGVGLLAVYLLTRKK